MKTIDHIAGHTWHGRKGAVENAFRYSIDYLMLDAEEAVETPWLFGRNRAGLASLWDSDHGGPPKQGRGAAWVREVLDAHGFDAPARIELLAQPRVMGHVFNPVAFWICRDAKGVVSVVFSEVTNTYGERYSYLCLCIERAPIGPKDRLTAKKIFHVSPFQKIEGGYEFRFDLRPDRIGIWIDFTGGNGGLIATLVGHRKTLTTAGLVRACLRRPFGSRRVLALIHWQALKLWFKGARFQNRPEPPVQEVSR